MIDISKEAVDLIATAIDEVVAFTNEQKLEDDGLEYDAIVDPQDLETVAALLRALSGEVEESHKNINVKADYIEKAMNTAANDYETIEELKNQIEDMQQAVGEVRLYLDTNFVSCDGTYNTYESNNIFWAVDQLERPMFVTPVRK